MPGEAMLKHAFGAHRSSVVFLVKKFSLNGLSALETRPTSFTLRSIPKAQISDVTYKHKGSWYTPPGPKLPEGDEIDYLPPAEAIGYVMSAEANFMRVRVTESTADGGDHPRDELLCVVRKLLKKMNRNVLVGDRVRVDRVDWVDGRGMINDVLPRRSELLNPGVANIDNIIVLLAFAEPPFDDYQVTRFLLAAEATGVSVTLVINKADLIPEDECNELIERVLSWGYSPIALSVSEGTGIKELSRILWNRWSVVVGPSGVGKSSLINYLRGRGRKRWWQVRPWKKSELAEIGYFANENSTNIADEDDLQRSSTSELDIERDREEMEEKLAQKAADGALDVAEDEWERAVYGRNNGGEATGEKMKEQSVQAVSGIGRGRHTTRTISFLDLPTGGLLADTPGFNLPDLSSVSLKDLPGLFPEIVTRMQENVCQFRDCSHLSEPGCVVSGDWERYPIYCRVFREVRDREFYDQNTLQLGKKLREGDVKVKSTKGGETKLEAKLNTKKHRRPSRRSRVQKLYDMVKEEVWDDFEDEDDNDEMH